jgi:hypothetical protein
MPKGTFSGSVDVIGHVGRLGASEADAGVDTNDRIGASPDFSRSLVPVRFGATPDFSRSNAFVRIWKGNGLGIVATPGLTLGI